MAPTSEGAATAAAVDDAARAIAAGSLVVYPTETVYGLGADALRAAAVERLVAVRGRPPGKPLAVLVAGQDMAEIVVAEFPPEARRLAGRFWPGPLTLVLPARAGLPPALTAGGDTIGVRISGHPLATALVAACARPITAPSANPPDQPPPRTLAAARGYFGGEVASYLDGGLLPGGASTVARVRRGNVEVLRPGPIAAEDLEAALAG